MGLFHVCDTAITVAYSINSCRCSIFLLAKKFKRYDLIVTCCGFSPRDPQNTKRHNMTKSKKPSLAVKPSKTESLLQKTVKQRIQQLGSSKDNEFGKAKFPYFTRRVLLGFADFIDNPHAYNNKLHDLYYCQSVVCGLQLRQRENCVKVMVAMCCSLEVETYQIGKPKADFMDGITHNAIMADYERCWGEPINPSKYFHTIGLLKLADFLVIDAVYLQDREVLTDLSLTDNDLPRVYSKAAYKRLTHKFISVFGLDNDDGAQKSKARSIAARIKAGLKTVWVRYEAFSDSFMWKKRKKAELTRIDAATFEERKRYPQGREITPCMFGGNYTTEH